MWLTIEKERESRVIIPYIQTISCVESGREATVSFLAIPVVHSLLAFCYGSREERLQCVACTHRNPWSTSCKQYRYTRERERERGRGGIYEGIVHKGTASEGKKTI